MRMLRAREYVTRSKVADAMGLSATTIVKLETGVCLPTSETLLKLCEYYNVDPNYLLVFDK